MSNILAGGDSGDLVEEALIFSESVDLLDIEHGCH